MPQGARLYLSGDYVPNLGEEGFMPQPPPKAPTEPEWKPIDVEGDAASVEWTCPNCGHENKALDTWECFDKNGCDMTLYETCYECNDDFTLEIRGEMEWNPLSARFKPGH